MHVAQFQLVPEDRRCHGFNDEPSSETLSVIENQSEADAGDDECATPVDVRESASVQPLQLRQLCAKRDLKV
jgi:hypothetical protein